MIEVTRVVAVMTSAYAFSYFVVISVSQISRLFSRKGWLSLMIVSPVFSSRTIYGMGEKQQKVSYKINICDDSQGKAHVSVDEKDLTVKSKSFYYEGQFDDDV